MQSNGSSIKLKVINNTQLNFYNLLGPFLSKRDIVKEIGNSIWDDQDKTWILALDKYKVVGFCAFKNKNGKIEFCSDYVIPEYRKKGIYTYLFDTRIKMNSKKHLIATVNENSINMYLKYGFIIKRINGRYTVVEKDLS